MLTDDMAVGVLPTPATAITNSATQTIARTDIADQAERNLLIPLARKLASVARGIKATKARIRTLETDRRLPSGLVRPELGEFEPTRRYIIECAQYHTSRNLGRQKHDVGEFVDYMHRLMAVDAS